MVNKQLTDTVQAAGGQIVAREETSLADWKAFDWPSDGTEEIAPSFPLIKLVQRTSRADGAERHVGEFWHSDREGDDAFEPELPVVALVMRKTRALFEEGEEQPSCMSADGVVPLANQPAWGKTVLKFRDGMLPISQHQPASCAACPLSHWDEETNEPPRCGEARVLLVVREDGTLAQLRLGRTSIRPFERWVGRFLKPKGLPLFSKRLLFMTVTKKKGNRIWEEIEVEGQSLDIEEAQRYAEIVREQRARFEQTLQEGSETTWQDDTPPSTGGQIIDPDTGEVFDAPEQEDLPFE